MPASKPLRFGIVQTAFPGDVVLALGLVETLHAAYPDAELHLLVRKGNEALVAGHPFLTKVWVWNKKQQKFSGLLKLALEWRQLGFHAVVNAQRFFTSGLFTALASPAISTGFDKNPLSALFTEAKPHTIIGWPRGAHAADVPAPHELERNHTLLEPVFKLWPPLTTTRVLPRLYPSHEDYMAIGQYQSKPYHCIAPASVWFTKQYPASQWQRLINTADPALNIYLIGGPADVGFAQEIMAGCQHTGLVNLVGKLGFLESAALMGGAQMNYTCDSAPLHVAGAMGAPVTAIFCSTVPSFGFGPMAANGRVVEVQEPLACRPCGLHGKRACPEGHFKCAMAVEVV